MTKQQLVEPLLGSGYLRQELLIELVIMAVAAMAQALAAP